MHLAFLINVNNNSINEGSTESGGFFQVYFYKKRQSMETPICPACGCSLIRLGLHKDKAVFYHYNDKQYWFCCDGGLAFLFLELFLGVSLTMVARGID